jgi:type I restriction enzyme S subunit
MTRVGEIADIESGIGFPKKYQGKKDGDVPFYKVMDISKTAKKSCIYIRNADNYISYDVLQNLKTSLIKQHSIVFAKIGAAIALNRRAILASDALVDNNIMAVYSPPQFIEPRYLYYFFITQRLGELSRATTIPSIRKSDIEEIVIPLPPRSEQHRIVTKIEELFTQLDVGIASLKKAQMQLKRYRQAILKAAFEGKLTAEWRERNIGKSRSPSQLIQDKSVFEPHYPFTVDDLPKLPQDWCWRRLGLIVKNHDGQRIPIKREDRKQIQGNYPYYGASGIIDYINDYLFDGDFLLISEDGANLLARSTPIAFSAKGKFWVNNHAHVIQTLYEIHLQFLQHYINSIRLEKYVTGTAQPKMTQKAMNSIPVPLPPIDEQLVVVTEIERLFSIADDVDKNLSNNLRQSEILRQSILKKAFEGKIVPQDPNDEPASVLLEIIKAEKAQITNLSKRKVKNVN